MNLLAHITKINGIRKEESLQEHCIKTAEYASNCLKNVGFYNMAYLAGLLHDMGKATSKFNDYLEAAFAGKTVVRGSVNHTFAGVIYLMENYHENTASHFEKLTAEIVSYAIGAHHGLFDCVDLDGKNGFSYRLNKDKLELCYEEAKNNYFEQVVDEQKINQLFCKATGELEQFCKRLLEDWDKDKQKFYFHVGLLTRLVLSSVIYGDRRDTGEFMGGISCLRENTIEWTSERTYFEKKLAQFDITSDINQIRSNISEQCLNFADRPAGIYRLNVPTGAGKTLCTLRYALAHAEKLQKKRIIFVIPLLSVLDQNAKVIREYIRDDNLILEHHSNVIREKDYGEDGAELDSFEIVTENWEAPIVITTLVQLLNILFTHKTSAVGRMRALMDSVIIIDEVQSLPKKTIAMFNMAINFLSMYCNATIVLSSATQPCLEKLDWPIQLAIQPDMVQLNKQQLQVFERADIIDKTTPYGMDLDEWVNFCFSCMEEHESLLVICNTKSEAKQLFIKMESIAQSEGWCISHLSTAMCQQHREKVLEELQNQLNELQQKIRLCAERKKVICISTQLVEAGVDFSFECVIRVLAGVDNLAQAAGRCNRSNEYGHKGKVYLINLKNENLSMLKEIADAQNSTCKVLLNEASSEEDTLIGVKATTLFYDYLFQQKDMKRKIKYPIENYGTIYMADLLANKNAWAHSNEPPFLHQPFRTIGERFQVFDDKTFDVLVPYGDGKELIEELKKMENDRFTLPLLKGIMQRTKKYTISIYQWQKEKLWEKGVLCSLFENRLLVLDERAYDCKYGVNDKFEQAVENYII